MWTRGVGKRGQTSDTHTIELSSRSNVIWNTRKNFDDLPWFSIYITYIRLLILNSFNFVFVLIRYRIGSWTGATRTGQRPLLVLMKMMRVGEDIIPMDHMTGGYCISIDLKHLELKKKKISSYFGCQMISNQFHRIIFIILSKIHLHTSIDHHLYVCVCVFSLCLFFFQLFINFWNLFFFSCFINNNKNYPQPLSRPNFCFDVTGSYFSNQSNPKKNDKCLKNNLIYSIYIYITMIWNLKQFSSAVLCVCVCVCVVSGYIDFVCFCFFKMNYSNQRDKRLHR